MLETGGGKECSRSDDFHAPNSPLRHHPLRNRKVDPPQSLPCHLESSLDCRSPWKKATAVGPSQGSIGTAAESGSGKGCCSASQTTAEAEGWEAYWTEIVPNSAGGRAKTAEESHDCHLAHPLETAHQRPLTLELEEGCRATVELELQPADTAGRVAHSQMAGAHTDCMALELEMLATADLAEADMLAAEDIAAKNIATEDIATKATNTTIEALVTKNIAISKPPKIVVI